MRANQGARRRFLGGRSPRAVEDAKGRQAPSWTDVAALAAQNAVHAARGTHDARPWLVSAGIAGQMPEEWTTALRLQSDVDRTPDRAHLRLAEDVFDYHVAKIGRLAEEKGPEAAAAAAEACLRALRRRAGCVRRVAEVVLPPWSGPPKRKLSDFVSDDPSRERVRSTAQWARTGARLADWPKTNAVSVVQPESARRRVKQERGGEADPGFLRGCEHRQVLPTATANRSDQWYWLQLQRPFSVEETLRANGCDDVGPEAPLSRGLRKLTIVESLETLGRSVHLESARYALRRLLRYRRASRQKGRLTYASAFSGVDTVAGALNTLDGEPCCPSGWDYRFLAEIDDKVRRAALAAWGAHGLQEARAHSDARTLCDEEWVELFVATPECCEFSPKQHDPDPERRADSLRDLNLCLRYVAERSPDLVLIENVEQASVPISGILGSLDGYAWERMTVCPFQHLGWPVRRLRSFWLGRRS